MAVLSRLAFRNAPLTLLYFLWCSEMIFLAVAATLSYGQAGGLLEDSGVGGYIYTIWSRATGM
jgi:hypothetical protein